MENVKIAEVYDAELSAKSLATYTAKDLLYLGADRTVRIIGGCGNVIMCSLRDQGTEDSYNLEILENIDIRGDISSYKNGSITVKKEEGKDTLLGFIGNSRQEIYVPITVISGMVVFYGNSDI